MKSRVLILIIFLHVAFISNGQHDTWDIPAMEIMISHNKRNYADHNEARDNQLVSEATVFGWKKSTGKFKTLSDFIDRRLTSAFIVLADVSTIYNIYSQLGEMIEYERKSLEIARRHPWMLAYMAGEQARIIESGNDLFSYISLLVLSYGDLNKMKVSARKVIFHSVNLQVSVLKAKCYSMYCMMKRLDITSEIKKSKPLQMINKDKQIVRDILKNLK